MKKYLILVGLIFISSLFSCNTQVVKTDEPVILGIFGGMGPEATADLYKQIVKLTPATKDQEHIPTFIYSLPQVPDRIASIANQDPAIIIAITEGVQRLENSGASFIAIPCNTVHYYYDDMQNAVSIPIIHMIKETVLEVKNNYPNVKKIGLLATSGTIKTKLYNNELEANGFEVMVPEDLIEEENVMKAVWGIKSGVDQQINEDLLAIAGQHLIDNGAELLILGCTEIPLAFNPDRSSVPVVNATKVLAERAISMYQKLNIKFK
jgi:aspartate racemase